MVSEKTLTVSPVKGFTKEQLALIKRTVAKDATDDELTMFMHIAKKAGLDPFLKEVWFVKYRGGETLMMTGRDGFLSIAQKSGEFTGLQSAVVFEGDTFKVDYTDPKDVKIKHLSNPFAKEAGKVVGAWARASRKNCIDTVEVVSWKDYYKGYAGRQSMWDKYPTAMIKKVAEAIALKKQYGIAGLVSREEMGYESEVVNAEVTVDSEKLLEDTMGLIARVPNQELKNKAIDNAIASGQFNEDQVKQLLSLKVWEKDTYPTPKSTASITEESKNISTNTLSASKSNPLPKCNSEKSSTGSLKTTNLTTPKNSSSEVLPKTKSE